MNRHRLLLIAALCCGLATAQQTISTYAGGGPNNVPATQANLNSPQGLAQDASGNIYIAASGANRVYKVDTSGVLTVLAGNGLAGNTGDSGPAIDAELDSPTALAVDSAGNVYVADNSYIREIHVLDGTISTVAGGGSGLGDGGPASQASISGATGLAVDNSGNVYIADPANQRIRRVDASTSILTTIAGGGLGTTQALQTSLPDPTALFLDASGNLYIGDSNLGEVLKMTLSSGAITAVAGGGHGSTATGAASGSVSVEPTGIFVDASGNIFTAGRSRYVLEFANGTVSVLGGGGGGGQAFNNNFGGPATSLSYWAPQDLVVQASGDLLVTDPLDEYVMSISGSGTLDQFAGNGSTNFAGENVAATSAALYVPVQHGPQSAVDPAGDLYFSDIYNSRVREVIAATGKIVTVAGTGTAGFSGDGNPATEADLSYPAGVALDPNGNLLIADVGNSRIRELVAATGKIKTVAGGGTNTGDGAPALQASLSGPDAVAVDSAGDIFIATNQRVQELSAATGDITTYAGGGTSGLGDGGPATSAVLNGPAALTFDAAGDLVLSDLYGNEVRKIDPKTGVISALAGGGSGGDGGLAIDASLYYPDGIAFDAAGDLFIADWAHNRVRRVDAATGIIETIAGTGNQGFSGDGGPAIDATLSGPASVSIDAKGNLFILDSGNERIREVTNASGQPVAGVAPTSLTFASQDVGQSSAVQTITITNSGAGNLDIASIAIAGANAADFSLTSGTTCAAGEPVVFQAICTLAISFKPSATGSESATVTITDDSTPTTQTVALSGTGVAAGVSIAPPSLTFGNQTVAETSKPIAITLSNTGTADLNFTAAPALSGSNAADFAIASGATCTNGATIAVSKTCTLSLTFKPSENGAESATLTFTDNATPTAQTVSLAGSGVLPVVALAPSSLSFTSQPQGTASAASTVTVTNQGPGDLIFTALAVSGGFAADFSLASATTCSPSAVVAAGATCTLAVVFTPSTTSSESATLTLTDNASGSGQTIGLSGTGAAPAPLVSLAPATLTFASQTVGTTSAAQNATLMNTGSAPLSLTSIAASGDFAQTNTCGSSLAANKSCTIAVTFTPTAAGSRTGTLTITDNASGSPHTIALTGTATAATPTATLSPTSLTFTSQLTASTSPAQTVTLTNSGAAVLAITSIAASGDFAETNTCGTSVAPGQNCTISVTFTPTATGSRTGTLSVTDNASDSPQTAALTGAGSDLTIAPSSGSSASASVTAGQPASYALSFTPVSGATGTFALACTGAPKGATCTPAPASISLSGTSAAQVTVSVTTTAHSLLLPAGGNDPQDGAPLWPLAVLLLLPVLAVAWRRRRRLILTTAGFAALSLLLACGGGSSVALPPPPSNSTSTGTPSGSYTLTLTASSGSISRSTTLTLVVH